MNTVLIVYHSRTGKTKKVAEEIALGVKEVKGTMPLLKTVAEVSKEDFLSASGIIAGSPVYFGTMAAELKALFDNMISLRKKMGGKIGAAFATSAHPSGGKETTMISIIQALLIYGMIIVGDPLDASGHYGIAVSGDMSEDDTSNARKLGKRVASLCKALYPDSMETRY